MPTDLSVAVVGPGAVGTTVAAALHEAGRTPRVYGRSARNSLRLEVAEGLIIVPGPVRTDPEEVDRPVDVVFLAVKSTQVESAGRWLTALCDDHTVLCVLQNGVEQEALVAPYLSDARVVPAVVWIPAEPQLDGSVRLRGEARLVVPNRLGARQVQRALRGTRCAVDLVDDFVSPAWHKLLHNAVAGLMVLTGRGARMYQETEIAHLVLTYLGECLDVGRAEGAVLSDDTPHQILRRFQAYPPDMRSSILTDRENGRPLEWEARNGVVRRLGRTHGIPTPISDLLVPLLAVASDGPG
jgi:2-dehydropantoate 2-reductase